MACCQKKGVKITTTTKPSLDDRKFTPKYTEKALTEKFYSKYENIDSTVKLSDDIAKDIETRLKYDRKQHYFAPVTENQVYGWYDHLANRHTLQASDQGLLLFQRKKDEIIAIMNTINVGLKQFESK